MRSSEVPSTSIQARERGWSSRLAVFVTGLLVFETVSGFAVWLLPFSVPNQFLVLAHTLGGLLFLAPFLVYQARHWLRYRRRAWSHYQVTGYVAFAAVAVNALSGVVLTVQGLLAARISAFWDSVHLVTAIAIVAFLLPHIALLPLRDRKGKSEEARRILRAERRFTLQSLAVAFACFLVTAALLGLYEPVAWNNAFPEGYSHPEGESPFAPSLAVTASGGAYDERSLSGSEGCGSSGCHEQIYREWSVSAHRWASMDPAFQAIQEVMAKQNGPDSTRYCGGCHDPISLFAGTKNVLTEDLSSLTGYDEGVSCLVCHSIRDTDLRGNANYTVTQPERYIYELEDGPLAKLVSDFLIRVYPRQHLETYSKRLYKTPEYCAACHKQFIDEEVNNVGWVQLQNQFDNWRKSKWNPEGEPEKVVECRECHMPLQASTDPAAGDALDPYRSTRDGKHRDHRFIGANHFVPRLLEIEGWEEHARLTEAWLKGERPIPEIAHKWAEGPAVEISIQAPESVRPGEPVDLRVVIASNKVGHDFPTGPLDIIQSWIDLKVTDEEGTVVYSSGQVDEESFIEPGSFMFKAEPVDRYGNLIDRHNLWEMVGVRFRRAIFPGFSDVASYTFTCPGEADTGHGLAPQRSVHDFTVGRATESGVLRVEAHLDYRKVDQYLLNYMFGKDAGLTAPVVRMASAEAEIQVEGGSAAHVAP